jgi:hypothetical protein
MHTKYQLSRKCKQLPVNHYYHNTYTSKHLEIFGLIYHFSSLILYKTDWIHLAQDTIQWRTWQRIFRFQPPSTPHPPTGTACLAEQLLLLKKAPILGAGYLINTSHKQSHAHKQNVTRTSNCSINFSQPNYSSYKNWSVFIIPVTVSSYYIWVHEGVP